MNINTIKDIVTSLYKDIVDRVSDSEWYHSLRKKYEILSSKQRKTLHAFLWFTLLTTVLYYPISHLYASWTSMHTFTTKENLIRELDLLSSANRSIGVSNLSSQNLQKSIKKSLLALNFPEKQIVRIEKTESVNLTRPLPFPVTIHTVAIEMKDLNLQEVTQYGYQLERLSDNLKILDIYIKENPKKTNYFNTTYKLSLFSLSKKSKPTQLESVRKPEPPIISKESISPFSPPNASEKMQDIDPVDLVPIPHLTLPSKIQTDKKEQ